jgi:hypothetical protein
MGAANDALKTAYGASFIQGTPNSDNCSGFIKSAGHAIGFNVPNKQADGIIEEFEKASGSSDSDWEKIGTGEEALKKAVALAFAGKLVIAAATAKDYGQRNGHVAIVLPKLGGPHKAPYVYGGGAEGARSVGDRTIREVWSPKKLGIVRFYVHRKTLLGTYD